MLDIKQKWDAEAQLGQMLRDAEDASPTSKETAFAKRLEDLANEYQMSDTAIYTLLRHMERE